MRRSTRSSNNMFAALGRKYLYSMSLLQDLVSDYVEKARRPRRFSTFLPSSFNPANPVLWRYEASESLETTKECPNTYVFRVECSTMRKRILEDQWRSLHFGPNNCPHIFPQIIAKRLAVTATRCAPVRSCVIYFLLFRWGLMEHFFLWTHQNYILSSTENSIQRIYCLVIPPYGEDILCSGDPASPKSLNLSSTILSICLKHMTPAEYGEIWMHPGGSQCKWKPHSQDWTSFFIIVVESREAGCQITVLSNAFIRSQPTTNAFR